MRVLCGMPLHGRDLRALRLRHRGLHLRRELSLQLQARKLLLKAAVLQH